MYRQKPLFGAKICLDIDQSADVHMFPEGNSFPRKVEKTVSFEEPADNVQGQISEHILKSNVGYCVYYPSNTYRKMKI